MDIRHIADRILSVRSTERTTIIGIDGLGGAGKSTISQSISDLLKGERLSVIVLHIDDFIHTRSVRYNGDYEEWECYYKLQWRYDYLLDEIIFPIKKGNSITKKVELYDKDNDRYYLYEVDAPVGSIVIIEGVFLQRKELCGVFDYMIYIDIPEEVRLTRVLRRDGYIGDDNQIKLKYDNRYFPAERHYVRECAPVQNADFVIEG